MAKGPQVDFLVMGAGVAGLRAAIELAQHGEVLVVTKESLSESNTHYAQGGIAVAMEGEKDVALHLEDTVSAGDGIVYRPAAEALVSEGPLRVAELIEWGANFDEATDAEGRRLDGQYLRTREGAHSLARILHASGDATGAEISRALVAFARAQKRIRFAEWTRVAALVVADGRVIGVDLAAAENPQSPSGIADHAPRHITARSILIASGGAGQVYSDTTNPAVATGDGIAFAASAGAELADMEFYQFHPTALAIEGAPRFLVSEALRGEGAYLRNHRGERFMDRYHPLLELAPRDVVARAIAREGLAESPAQSSAAALRPVFLDMRHVHNIDLIARFPGISAFLAQYGLDLRRDLIPVRPAAHYLMGGIRTDLGGRTSLAGLYAAGEAACTGVHGANRLASNSLLEGLVFGTRAARSMLADSLPLASVTAAPAHAPQPLSATESQRVETLIASLQASMWANAGLLRQESSLRHGLAAQAQTESTLAEIAATGRTSRRLAEAQALSRVAHAILTSALARSESRGAHFRSDHPRHDDANFRKHSVLSPDGRVRFEAW
ncbi:MAG: L-aspartate oxidase [Terracidiphilus sp.]|nr:L-aspartate oxidase [Terracidiphilus sp.]MDR3796769.1 L-aspartate oxidase [Terracidiphilus sp.]